MSKERKLFIVDDLSPEDIAMVQALYSRSAESAEVHIEKVRKGGSGKFMSTYYVGYGHKSIADCGSTTMFIENVSLLAAKAIQDWPLYCGQETSTRYINMAEQNIINPLHSTPGMVIQDDWMQFYKNNQDRVSATVKERYPIKEGEAPATYEKAVKARTFDILRGFLPAGITTQLAWHTNLRQAGDHLTWLRWHPAEEIRDIAVELRMKLGAKYSSSGGGLSLPSVSGVDSKSQHDADQRSIWEAMVADMCTYSTRPISHSWEDVTVTIPQELQEAVAGLPFLSHRPRGSVIPHLFSDLGQVTSTFLLDFGSFRDIQRHRNGVCRMPLLTTSYGFEDWYLEQLDEDLQKEARDLIKRQTLRIHQLTNSSIDRQYYTALGFRVPCSVTYALPALVYVLELRSGKSVHPTLRKVIHQIIWKLKSGGKLQNLTLHVDLDPDDWDVRRGLQDITKAPPA